MCKMQVAVTSDQPMASEALGGVLDAGQDGPRGATKVAEDMVRTLHFSQHLAVQRLSRQRQGCSILHWIASWVEMFNWSLQNF